MEKEVAIEILNKVLADLKMKPSELSFSLGMKRPQGLYDVLNPEKTNVGISQKLADSISDKFPQFNKAWLLTGDSALMNQNSETIKKSTLIPFYDDITSFGGTNNQISETQAVYETSEYINAGDWFRDATAAIRHYGDSMTEYPSGCILALKEVQDKTLIVWGKDYVIETSEYRITKRLQTGKSEGYITAYSSNTETYPDGRQVHEPVSIALSSINRLMLVLGYVVKKNGGTMIFSNKNH